MNKFYLTLLTVFLLVSISFAQSNFKPGYVVTLSGDTIKGQVDYREWDSNPSSIRFRTLDNKIRNFTPTDIKKFSINGLDTYQRYSGPISHDETNSNRIVGGRDTSFLVQEVFLKVLQTGKVIDLFSYSDAIKPRYFYSDPGADNVAHELIYRIYYTGDVSSIQKGNTTIEAAYLQQLTAIALKADVLNDGLQKTMDGAGYTTPDLMKIVTKMNGYTKAQVVLTQAGGNKDSFDFYGGLGVNITTTTSRDQNGNIAGASYTSVLPKALIGFNAYVNPNTRKLVFSAELSVTDIKYKNSFSNSSYSFDQLVTSLTPAVNYNVYNGENFKFYLSIGFGISKYTFFNKKFLKYDGTPLPTTYLPFLFSSYNNAVTYKVGFLVHKRLQVYAEHLTGNPISHDSFYGLKQSSNNIGLNYFFSRQK